jgi:hypothetical protein
MTRTGIAALIVGVVVVLGLAMVGRYFFGGHAVPPGQLPLTEVAGDTLDSLKNDFNRTPDQIRIVLLLSPT